jgi:hypothetical protein
MAAKVEVPPALNFAMGGLSGCVATISTHPIDLVKTRMQLEVVKPSIVRVVGDVMRAQGVGGFYKGCVAALAVGVTLIFVCERRGSFVSV